MDLFSVVEVTTSITTYLMVASGLPPCLHMYRTKSTKNVPYLFFLVGFLNAVAGVYYGMLARNSTIFYINVVCVVVNLLYMGTYLLVCRSKSKPVGQLGLVILILIGYFWYLHHFFVGASVIQDKLGLFLFVASTILMSTPALEIVDCVRNQSASGMSLAMLYGGLLCAATWLLYGLLLKDFYIYAPNIVGVVTHLGKVAMLFVYPSEPLKRD